MFNKVINTIAVSFVAYSSAVSQEIQIKCLYNWKKHFCQNAINSHFIYAWGGFREIILFLSSSFHHKV